MNRIGLVTLALCALATTTFEPDFAWLHSAKADRALAGIHRESAAHAELVAQLVRRLATRRTVSSPRERQMLAETIVRCLSDPADYARLKHGAVARAGDFAMAAHLADLIPILESVAGRSQTVSSPTIGR